MAENKKSHSGIKRLQQIKTWQLLIILLLVGFISASFLRLNNIGMIERRDAVIDADNLGDDEKIQNRLFDLQRYVSSHMNTDMGKGIYLESTYNRAIKTAYENASVDTNPNGNIYKKVQEICKPKYTHWTYEYMQCTTDELAKYPAGASLISSVNLPSVDSYRHAFVSPLWSADFAGLSVLIFVVILIMILIRLIGVIILKMLLRHRYKSI